MSSDGMGADTSPPAVQWGAVAVGAVAGIAAAMIPALAIVVLGGTPVTNAMLILLLVVAFAGQLTAGFVAGAAARRRHATHGSLGSAAGFLVLAAVTMAAAADPGIPNLAFGLVMALVFGAAGGVLAAVALHDV